MENKQTNKRKEERRKYRKKTVKLKAELTQSFSTFAEPGAVSFTLSQPADSAQTLQLSVVCPEETQRNGDIVNFTYRYYSTVEASGAEEPEVCQKKNWGEREREREREREERGGGGWGGGLFKWCMN